jgi:hypothetical protein
MPRAVAWQISKINGQSSWLGKVIALHWPQLLRFRSKWSSLTPRLDALPKNEMLKP